MKLQIIVGSVREGSMGSKVGAWAAAQAQQVEGVEVELLDLHNWPLPFYNETMPPLVLQGKYKSEIGAKWAKKITEADAYLFITPEYNHGYSAAIKNATDWIGTELKGKPAAILGYSMTPHGGTRAVEQLKPVLVQLNALLLGHNVLIGKVHELLNDSGEFGSAELSTELVRSLTDLMELQRKLSASPTPLAAAV